MKITIIWRKEVKRKKHPWYIRFFFPLPNERRNVNEHTTEENAITDNLRSIHQMVKLVKQDEEVSLQYMKIFEREEMLIQQGIEQGIEQGIQQGIEQGIQQGRKAEQANTELERKRAEKEKARADQLEKELQYLKEKLKQSL